MVCFFVKHNSTPLGAITVSPDFLCSAPFKRDSQVDSSDLLVYILRFLYGVYVVRRRRHVVMRVFLYFSRVFVRDGVFF